jgi:hypothetical protein
MTATPAKAIAAALPSRLAGASDRAAGEHCGIGSPAVGSFHCRLADRRDALQMAELMAAELMTRR